MEERESGRLTKSNKLKTRKGVRAAGVKEKGRARTKSARVKTRIKRGRSTGWKQRKNTQSRD